ncbi:MAG: hypothetical protein R2827_07680 [Bdellovibrionales bacterium]
MYLSSTPLDATMLIDRTGSSKALVSISLKELLYYGVIVEVPKSLEKNRPMLQIQKLLMSF